eukprot:tig00020553_g10575.t2
MALLPVIFNLDTDGIMRWKGPLLAFAGVCAAAVATDKALPAPGAQLQAARVERSHARRPRRAMVLSLSGFGAGCHQNQPREPAASAGGTAEEERAAATQTEDCRRRGERCARRRLSGRKRSRGACELESPTETAAPEEGAAASDEAGRLRAALARARAELAAERALRGTRYVYVYPEVQVPAALRHSTPASRKALAEGATVPAGQLAELRGELRRVEGARRRYLRRRTGVFVAATAAEEEEEEAEAEEATGALPDELLLRVFELLAERGWAEGALPEAHRQLCAAMRVCRRWRRLASEPRLWSTFHLRAHALQLPWALHALAALPRFASLSHLSLDLVVGGVPPDFREAAADIAGEMGACLSALASSSGANSKRAGPPPLPDLRELDLRILEARPIAAPAPPAPACEAERAQAKRSVLALDREGVLAPAAARLPWLPACTPDDLRSALRPLPKDSAWNLFGEIAARLRLSERFPGLRRLSLPGDDVGRWAALCRLGAPSSSLEELDARVDFSRGVAHDPRDSFLRAFPRLRWLRSASASTGEALEQLRAQLAPAGPAGRPPPGLELGRLKVANVEFGRGPECGRLADVIRACIERLRPRVLSLNGCSGLDRLAGAIGPSVQELVLGPGTLSLTRPEDFARLAGSLPSVRELTLACHTYEAYDAYDSHPTPPPTPTSPIHSPPPPPTSSPHTLHPSFRSPCPEPVAGGRRDRDAEMLQLAEAAMALPALRRLRLRGPAPATLGGARRLAALRAAGGLGPVAVARGRPWTAQWGSEAGEASDGGEGEAGGGDGEEGEGEEEDEEDEEEDEEEEEKDDEAPPSEDSDGRRVSGGLPSSDGLPAQRESHPRVQESIEVA